MLIRIPHFFQCENRFKVETDFENLFFYLGDIWTFEFLKSTLFLKKNLIGSNNVRHA